VRRIPLRTVDVPGEQPFSYADALRLVIRQPLDTQKGVSIEEMRLGIRILDRIDAAGDVLELEDADYEHLVLKLKAMAWGMVERRLLEFIDTVLEAPEASTNGQVVKAGVAAS
jgi:hypothetical protein